VSSNAPAQFPVGTNLVSWTVTDASGNRTTCAQRIVVRDTSRQPSPARRRDGHDRSRPLHRDGSGLGQSITSDNCGTVLVSSNAPVQFPVGTNTVTWTATDASGNRTTCSQRVVVRDIQAPTLACPADRTVTTDPGACVATGVALGSPTTSDNCGTVTVSSNAPAQFPVGTNTVTWTATDASGNRTTCAQQVVVRDAQPPTLTCPADMTVATDPGLCVATGVALATR